VTGAGLGMSGWEMTTLLASRHTRSTMPGMAAMSMPVASIPWGITTWTLMITMWWTMMIAMMVPSATPAILLYSRVHSHVLASENGHDKLASTWAFAAGYLLTWLGFAIAATFLQWSLERAGLISASWMSSQSRWLSATVLISAGLYQLSPFKHSCLAHCRSPAAFLSRHWRPGAMGALRLGGIHGVYCVGCCWMLMTLLFVGGVMNILWIAVLTCLVLSEKVLPAGPWVGRSVGLVLIGWGLLILVAWPPLCASTSCIALRQ
jgi:predicted metal-binding membrane protein